MGSGPWEVNPWWTFNDFGGRIVTVPYHYIPSGETTYPASDSGIYNMSGGTGYGILFHGAVHSDTGSWSTGTASGSVSAPGGDEWDTSFSLECDGCNYSFEKGPIH